MESYCESNALNIGVHRRNVSLQLKEIFKVEGAKIILAQAKFHLICHFRCILFLSNKNTPI